MTFAVAKHLQITFCCCCMRIIFFVKEKQLNCTCGKIQINYVGVECKYNTIFLDLTILFHALTYRHTQQYISIAGYFCTFFLHSLLHIFKNHTISPSPSLSMHKSAIESQSDLHRTVACQSNFFTNSRNSCLVFFDFI